MNELMNLKRKVGEYKEVLNNTTAYRKAWNESLRDAIINKLEEIIKETELPAEIETNEKVENLESIVLNLGQAKSGLYEKLNNDVNRHLIKHNGSLVYQQLFNGKVVVLIMYPTIEGYGQPAPPKQVGIYRPEEIKPPFIIRHMESFIKEMTNWEDYDDDDKGIAPPQPIGFNMNMHEGLITDEE